MLFFRYMVGLDRFQTSEMTFNVIEGEWHWRSIWLQYWHNISAIRYRPHM